MCILAHFCMPVSLHNKNVLLPCLINDMLQLVIRHWGVRLYYCGVERDCPRADGDGLAGDWAASNDSVHDVLVNKKFNAMLVFILLFAEENLVSLSLIHI